VTARYDVVVVGGGHNGLVCAGYLARAGLRVVVLERRDRPGGAVDTVELEPGFRLAAVAHDVGRLRTGVVRDLLLESHGLRPIRPAARMHATKPDDVGITLWGDPRRTAEELSPRSTADAAAYPGFDRKVRALASFLARLHAATPPDLTRPSPGDALTGARLARSLRKLGGPAQVRETLRILPMAAAEVVGEEFETDLLRGAIASRGVRYTAMGPWAAGTAVVLLADSAGHQGGAAGPLAFAAGGPGALAEALTSSVRSFGGEVRLGAEVAAVISQRGVVTGVALVSGEEVPAPVVVSGADPKRTLLGLIDPEELGPTLAWETGNVRTPGAVAKVNLTLDGLPSFGGAEPERLAGRIVVAGGVDDLERGSDAWKYGRVSEAPFLEATIPSLSDPSLAPEGSHVMSVLVQWAPYHLREGDWDGDRGDLGDLVLKRLEEVAPGISGMVREQQVLTPLDLERDYGLTEGHPLHGEPGLDQWFAWRPLLGFARYRMPIRGLYLCGSGAHPGGGVTGGPGANAAREVLADLRRRRS
jgi:phytoene dehydrogenase-like protein